VRVKFKEKGEKGRRSNFSLSMVQEGGEGSAIFLTLGLERGGEEILLLYVEEEGGTHYSFQLQHSGPPGRTILQYVLVGKHVLRREGGKGRTGMLLTINKENSTFTPSRRVLRRQRRKSQFP